MFFPSCGLISLLCIVQSGSAAEPKPSLSIQSSLYFTRGKAKELVKRLPLGYEFKGNAITRDGNVLLSYEAEDSEPSTLLSIYDLRLRREHVFVELRNTADASFSYNAAADLVAFNWFDGIYVFSLDEARKIPADRYREDAFKKLTVPVAKCTYCYEPRWTKDNRIVYIQWGKSEDQTTVYADVPLNALRRE